MANPDRPNHHRSETKFTSVGSEVVLLDDSNALPPTEFPFDPEEARKIREEYKQRIAEWKEFQRRRAEER